MSLEEELNVIDKVGMVEVPHYYHFCQQLVFSLMIRNVNSLDGKLKVMRGDERCNKRLV